MNKMKIIGALVMTAACGGLFSLLGCITTVTPASSVVVTNPDGTLTTNIVAAITNSVPDTNAIILGIELVVPNATLLAVTADPKAKQYLAAAATVLQTFAGGTDLSPDALSRAIATTKVKEINSPQIKAVISNLLLTYNTHYAQVVNAHLPQSQYLVPIIQAVAANINQGLAGAP